MTDKLTAWEVVGAFPDEEPTARREMRRVRRELSWYFDNIERICEDYVDDFERMYFVELNKMSMPQETLKRYEFLKKVVKIYRTKKKLVKEGHSSLDIDLIKHIPIVHLYDFQKKTMKHKIIMASCPFHEDTTPSFVIYKETNHYHCFSCAGHGDNIDFVMKIMGMNFIEAVKFLIAWR